MKHLILAALIFSTVGLAADRFHGTYDFVRSADRLGNATQIFMVASCEDTSGSGTVQSCSTATTFTLSAGDSIRYKTTTENTGDLTIAVNGSSAIHVRKWLGASVLTSGDLPANIYVLLTYDGTYLEMPTIGNAPSAGAGTVTHTGSLTSGQLLIGNATADITVGNLSGDVTTAGSTATTLANIPNAVPMAGDVLATNITAPATPASGKTSIYVDSTSKNLAAKNDAGTVNHGVQTKAAASTKFLTAIADDGTVSNGQPADSDLSISNITTNNVTTSQHGFAPTLSNNAATYLDGTGHYTTPGSASGSLVLIQSQTASGGGSLDFLSCFSSTYDNYHVEIKNLVPHVNATDINLRFHTASGWDATGGHYSWAALRWVYNTSGLSGGQAAESIISLTGGVTATPNTASLGGVVGFFKVYDPLSGAANTRVVGETDYDATSGFHDVGLTITGSYLSTTAVDGFRILAATGALDSGTVRCYGIAK